MLQCISYLPFSYKDVDLFGKKSEKFLWHEGKLRVSYTISKISLEIPYSSLQFTHFSDA